MFVNSYIFVVGLFYKFEETFDCNGKERDTDSIVYTRWLNSGKIILFTIEDVKISANIPFRHSPESTRFSTI